MAAAQAPVDRQEPAMAKVAFDDDELNQASRSIRPKKQHKLMLVKARKW